MTMTTVTNPASENNAAGGLSTPATQEAIAQAALDYCRRQWSVTILCPPDHVGVSPTHAAACDSLGKRPWHLWKRCQSPDGRLTEAEINRLLRRNRRSNVGMALGPASGLVGIDGDGMLGEAMLLAMSGGDLPRTLTFRTPGGGRRLLYRIPEGIRLRISHKPIKDGTHEGMSFLCEGSQTVMPPSVHKTGGTYEWGPGLGPGEVEPADCPAWVVERLREDKPRERTGKARTPAAKVGEVIKGGSRHVTLTSLAGAMRRRGMGEDEIAAALLAVNRNRCDPPLDAAAVKALARDICDRYPPAANGQAAGGPHLTDVGNGQRLVARHGQDIRFCGLWGKWLHWTDDRRWAVDHNGEVERRAKETVRAIYQESADEPDPDRRQALARHAAASERSGRVAAMLAMAASEPGVPVLPGQLDVDPMLLNVLNGVVDLRTGDLRGHRRGDYLTKLCPTQFDPTAACPGWCKFLNAVFGKDAALIRFVQKFFGYAVTGDIREHAMAILCGSGSNGKTTLLNTVGAVLGGDYCWSAPSELLTVGFADRHPTEVADLFGRRLVSVQEFPKGKPLNEPLVKRLTGGDPVTARRMREDFWTFAPTHKFVVSTNNKPRISGTDEGIWRRIRLVPFLIRFWDPDKEAKPGEERSDHLRADKGLPAKLLAERPGILAWLVAGCLLWQEEGLGEPHAVAEATEEYREQEDVVGNFLAEKCVRGPDYRVKAGDLYAAFKQWAEQNGERSMSQREFGLAMTQRGFERQDSSGLWYLGVGVSG
jgi:putative DNA primase/helicase